MKLLFTIKTLYKHTTKRNIDPIYYSHTISLNEAVNSARRIFKYLNWQLLAVIHYIQHTLSKYPYLHSKVYVYKHVRMLPNCGSVHLQPNIYTVIYVQINIVGITWC